jgi:hypothetical protein
MTLCSLTMNLAFACSLADDPYPADSDEIIARRRVRNLGSGTPSLPLPEDRIDYYSSPRTSWAYGPATAIAFTRPAIPLSSHILAWIFPGIAPG